MPTPVQPCLTPAAARAAARSDAAAIAALVRAHWSDVRRGLGVRGGVCPSDQRVRDDFDAVHLAFERLRDGASSGVPALDAFFAEQCGGAGIFETPEGLQPSPLDYARRQLWRGDKPLTASLLQLDDNDAATQYLASAAPDGRLLSKEDYFWLLWEHGVSNVVSLVPSPWWPRPGSTTIGELTLTVASSQQCDLPALDAEELVRAVRPGFIEELSACLTQRLDDLQIAPVRRLQCTLTRGDETRAVSVTIFENWPDRHPVHGATLKGLVKAVGPVRSRTGTTAVNCYAGVGRTGTFIAAEATLAAFQGEPLGYAYEIGLLNLFKLRCQRPQMIQEASQLTALLAACQPVKR